MPEQRIATTADPEPARHPFKVRRCAQTGCLRRFQPRRQWQVYCSPRCRWRAWKDRQALVEEAKALRAAKGQK